jgi:hypothetical protein
MDALTSKASRLRALRRLVEYATTESRELEMAGLEQLLGAAALAIEAALQEDARLSAAARRHPRMKLVIGGAPPYGNRAEQ